LKRLQFIKTKKNCAKSRDICHSFSQETLCGAGVQRSNTIAGLRLN